MSTLTIDNTVTVTQTSSTLNISVVSGQRFNVITVTGPVGPSGAPGLPGTGAVDLSGYVPTSRTVNTHALTGDVTVLARDIPVDHVPGAGYSDLQQFINVMHSPGLIDGAIITDGGGGNALVSPGTGMLRVADDNTSSLAFVSISGASLAVPPDVVQYYIGFVYNGGHPMFELRATNDWDNDTEIPLGTVVNFFGQLIITNNPFLVGDPITNIIQRFDAMAPVSRDETVGGLALGEIGSRNVTLSAGRLWTRLNDYDVEAIDTSISGSIYSAYYNGSFWNYNVGVTQWDNLQYNDITAGLVPIQPGYFANLWFYLTIENNSLGFIYGQDQLGNLSDASNEGAPSFLPDNFLNGSILVGRMIFHSGALVADAIDSAFTTQFASSPVTAHNSLAGIQGGLPGEYYHLEAFDYNKTVNLADHLTLNSTLSLTGASGANLDLGNGGRLGATAFTGVSGVNGLTGGVYIGGSQGISVSQSGQTIYMSGQDWATNTSLGALSGYVTGVSGGLQAQITAGGGTQVKISGSTTLATANFTGLGGTLVFSSGGFVFVSGAAGAGGVTQAQLDSLSGWSASAVNLTTTGATLATRDTLISGVLTTGLLNTGQQLYNLIIGASGQANTNYATVPNLALTGSGLYTLVTGASGQANANFATIPNLALTGSGLYATLTGMSGQDATNYATKTNLALTGQTLYSYTLGTSGAVSATGTTLYNLTTALSGQLKNDLASTGSLLATGQSLYAYILGTSGAVGATGTTLYNLVTALSGQLNNNHASTGSLLSTGQQLYSYILGASGAVGVTGTTLYNLIVGASGQANNNYASTGNLLLTGQSLYNGLVLASGAAQNNGINLSGNLTQSGIQLQGIIALTGSGLYRTVTGMSGALVALIGASAAGVSSLNGASGVLNLNGAGNVSITTVGQTITVSGNTGDYALFAQKTDVTTTGTLLSAIKVTGSSILNTVNFTGLGGTLVIASGGFLFISGATSAGGGITQGQLDSLSGFSTGFSGTLGTQIFNTGSTLYGYVLGTSGAVGATGTSLYNLVTALSGQSNVNYATTGNLFATGQSLYNLITTLSGQLNNNHASTGALLATGQALYAYVTTTSGAVGTTGTTLYNLVTALSGQSNINYATTGGLLATGQALYGYITALSGQANANYATTGNLLLTGQGLYNYVLGTSGTVGTTGATLYNLVTALSGQLNTNHASTGALLATGQALYAYVLGTSGAVGVTGTTLYNLITGLSGQANTNYATVANLALTGQQAFQWTTGLSGFVIVTSGALQAQIAGGGSQVKVTGSATLATPDFTGIGTTLVFTSGGKVFISGAPSSAGGGVPSVNGITSAVTIGGVGNLTASVSGSTIYISGSNVVTDKQVLFDINGATSGNDLLQWDYGSGTFKVGSPLMLYTGNPISAGGSGSSVIQVTVSNRSTTNSATSDYVATVDVGSDFSGYVNLGINNSQYNQQAFDMGGAKDGYLIVDGGNLDVATTISGKIVRFFTAGTRFFNQRAAISDSGIQMPSTGIISFDTGLFINNRSINSNSGTLSFTGMANNPIAAMYTSGWGNTYYGPAAYNRRIRTIVPATTTTQFVTNDTAATVGTVSTLLSETLGEVSQYTPTIGLSAGTSFAIASAFRGSVAGVGNGFFFVTKFLLNQAWASGIATGPYAAPSGSRVFVGLTDQAVATQTQLNDPVGNHIGLTYLWASGGAAGTGFYMQNWAVRSRDNVATSTGDIGMVFQTGYYRFAMYCPPFPGNTQVYYQLDDLLRGSGVKGQITQNLPVGSTAMRGMAAIGFVSGVKTIGTSVVYQETPNSSSVG